MSYEQIDEQYLPKNLPQLAKDHIKLSLDVTRAEPRTGTHQKMKENGSRYPVKNKDEILQKWQKAFNDQTLNAFWEKLESKKLLTHFIDELVFQIPIRYESALFAKQRKSELKDAYKTLKGIVAKLSDQKLQQNIYPLSNAETRTPLRKATETLEEELKKIDDGLNTDWITGKEHAKTIYSYFPKARQLTQAVFYQKALYFWLYVHTGKPHEKEIAVICEKIFELENGLSESTISSNCKDIRAMINKKAKLADKNTP